MKPTIKVSIGSYAFNLEESAFDITDNYLKTLKQHFAQNAEGNEIISDVEVRIAELFRMQMANEYATITEDDAKTVIQTIGSPADFGDESNSSIAKEEPNTIKKKLFRDADNAILGGVCSGLGHFFNIDPVLIRILFVTVLFIIGVMPFGGSAFFVVLIYLVLWIAMPKARSFAQKLEMTGTKTSLYDIENRNIQSPKPQGSRLLKVLKIICGVFMGIIGVTITISIIAIISLFLGAFYSKGGAPDLISCLEAIGVDSWNQRIALIMVICLPLIGLLYITIKLLFTKRFGRADWVISLIAFIIWIGAGCYVGGFAFSLGQEYRRNYEVTENIQPNTMSDKLYIKLDNSLADASPVSGHNPIYYLKDNTDNYSFFIIPKIRVQKDTTLTSFKIALEKKAYDKTRGAARRRSEIINLDYTLNDSLLVICPKLYNKNNLWDRTSYRLVISVPSGKDVDIDDYLCPNNWNNPD
ncbi:PspC domain-containing protein [Dysgonomonas sp. 216]|uniref:PspC domain-containing protein n=1 Tax=Dysgonomonas sp. 216 TaxID=2302934 RepID=UPI0013CFD3A3|nr:PspC domain-containing protein [Dysgonomonas sp. 216]NDW18975.1 PspC domain-containing protein [Dysgonomonas sp. 216]